MNNPATAISLRKRRRVSAFCRHCAIAAFLRRPCLSWIDFATGDSGGDVVSLLAARDGIGQVDAAGRLAALLLVPMHVADEGSRKPHRLTIDQEERRHEAVRIEIAARIWREAVPAGGTPVETYLIGRGLPIPDGCDLRFHPTCPIGPEKGPAMVGLFRDVTSNDPCGIHRTFLKPDGSGKAGLPGGDKLMLGRSRGACIKLSPDEDVDLGLGIAEGIETGLAVLNAGWAPVWATGSARGIEAFPVLSGIECLTIFADAGEPECARPGAALNAGRQPGARWLSTNQITTTGMRLLGQEGMSHEAA